MGRAPSFRGLVTSRGLLLGLGLVRPCGSRGHGRDEVTRLWPTALLIQGGGARVCSILQAGGLRSPGWPSRG